MPSLVFTSPVKKEVESFDVSFANNGYIVSYSGRDDDDDWISAKFVLTDIKDLFEVIGELDNIRSIR